MSTAGIVDDLPPAPRPQKRNRTISHGSGIGLMEHYCVEQKTQTDSNLLNPQPLERIEASKCRADSCTASRAKHVPTVKHLQYSDDQH
jgi:hypothetical protein